MTRDLIINACLTGMIPMKDRNPHVPISPDEIIADVRAVAKLGASVVHLHARDADGAPTWDPGIYREIIAGIRAAVPDLVICVSTSGRLWNDRERRSAVLKLDGPYKPDMASLTLGSLNFPRQASVNAPDDLLYLLDAMNGTGIRPELEIFDLGMVDYLNHLAAEGRVRAPMYANILLGNRGTADACEQNLSYLVSRLPAGCTWAACGIGKAQLPINRLAIEKGGHVRVGLEDNLWLDHAAKVPATNAQLVARLVDIARSHGRGPMPPAETRRLLALDER